MDPNKPARSLSPADFLFGGLIGEGAYARVVHVKMKHGGNGEYACKVLDKRFVKKEKKTHFVMMERNVLSRAKHANVVHLSFTFQDASYLYFVLELCRGGDLLRSVKAFSKSNLPPIAPAFSASTQDSENKSDAKAVAQITGMPLHIARYYIAQLCNALEYLHTTLGIVHRDVKPENVLLTERGFLKLSDFGSCKDENETFDDARQDAFVGTAEYVSPEVLQDESAHAPSDLWAMGCVAYQLLTGRPPFRGASEYLTFQQVLGYDKEATYDAQERLNKLKPRSRSGISELEKIQPPLDDIQTLGEGFGVYVVHCGKFAHGDEDKIDLSDFYATTPGGAIEEDRSGEGIEGNSGSGELTGSVRGDVDKNTVEKSGGQDVGVMSADSSSSTVDYSSPMTRRSGSGGRFEHQSSKNSASPFSSTRKSRLSSTFGVSKLQKTILRFPSWMPSSVIDFILALLAPNPSDRLGVVSMERENGISAGNAASATVSSSTIKHCGPVLLDYSLIKTHEFFKGVDWDTISDPKTSISPFIPTSIDSILDAFLPIVDAASSASTRQDSTSPVVEVSQPSRIHDSSSGQFQTHHLSSAVEGSEGSESTSSSTVSLFQGETRLPDTQGTSSSESSGVILNEEGSSLGGSLQPATSSNSSTVPSLPASHNHSSSLTGLLYSLFGGSNNTSLASSSSSSAPPSAFLFSASGLDVSSANLQSSKPVSAVGSRRGSFHSHCDDDDGGGSSGIYGGRSSGVASRGTATPRPPSPEPVTRLLLNAKYYSDNDSDPDGRRTPDGEGFSVENSDTDKRVVIALSDLLREDHFESSSSVLIGSGSNTSVSPSVAAVAITTPLVDASVASSAQDTEQSSPSVILESATSTKAPSAAVSWSRLLGGKLV